MGWQWVAAEVAACACRSRDHKVTDRPNIRASLHRADFGLVAMVKERARNTTESLSAVEAIYLRKVRAVCARLHAGVLRADVDRSHPPPAVIGAIVDRHGHARSLQEHAAKVGQMRSGLVDKAAASLL
jgi:hypothetical protein